MRVVIALILAVAAIGCLGFLVRGALSVDSDLHVQRLDLLQKIANLDDGLDRAVTLEITSALLDSRKQRSELSVKMGDTLEHLESGPLALRGLNPDVDAALDVFQEKIGDKFGLAFDFESKTNRGTERLIRSVDSVTAFIGELVQISDDRQVLKRIRNLQYALTTYSVSPKPSEIISSTVTQRTEDLRQLAETQSAEFQRVADKLFDSIRDVETDKTELVQLLNDYLGIPTAASLQALEQAYIAHHETSVEQAKQYQSLLAGYSAVLLLVLVWLGIRLRRSYSELDQANETLEEQVQERTRDLSQALDNLRDSQAQLVQSEKMASLGQMVAGVAHEINTPLGYARSNGEIVRESLRAIHGVCEAQHRALELMNTPDASEEDIAQAIQEAYSLESQTQTSALAVDLDNLLNDSEHGLSHIAGLVESLKDFSRVDRSRQDLYDLNQGVDTTLRMCRNHIRPDTRVSKTLGKIPEIECSPSQINQVLMNLITNAAQAVGENGRIFVHTREENGGVSVRVLDNGSGMTEEVRAQVFDPFYTTKPVGEGTGLGLSISYRIVEDHGGEITVKSVPGKGSEFAIWLPLRQQKEGDAVPFAASEDTALAGMAS